MKKFENLKMVLFDSTKASFKLAVEAQFTRGNREQGFRDLVYVTDRYTAMLNPNIYVTVTYKDENANPVYMSYPQLFRLREAFEKVKELVLDESSFVNIDGAITIRQDRMEPVVLANIGKNNNWISMKLSVFQSEENGIIVSTPGVSIELSTANRYSSALSIDEFLTVYTIIKDLDLASIQCMMSLAFLDTERGGTPAVAYYQQPQQQYQPQPQYVQYQQPYQNNGGYQQPYGQQNYGSRPQYQQPAAPQPRYNNQNARRTSGGVAQAPVPSVSQPAPEQTSNFIKPQQNGNVLPPRDSGKPLMNPGAIEKVEIDEIKYDDLSNIDDLFGE